MARGKKTGGRDFQPGHKHTVKGGRPKTTPEMRVARDMTQTTFMALVQRFLVMDRTELQRVIKDPATPMLDVIVGSIVAKAATGSDHQRLDFLITRIIGKVKEPDQTLNLNLSTLSRSEVIELGREAVAFLTKLEKDA